MPEQFQELQTLATIQLVFYCAGSMFFIAATLWLFMKGKP